MDDPIKIEDSPASPTGAGAAAPDNGLTGEDVLKAADLALYDAKSRSQRGERVRPACSRSGPPRARARPQAALSRELEVQYQLLKDAAMNETVGYEALFAGITPNAVMSAPPCSSPLRRRRGRSWRSVPQVRAKR